MARSASRLGLDQSAHAEAASSVVSSAQQLVRPLLPPSATTGRLRSTQTGWTNCLQDGSPMERNSVLHLVCQAPGHTHRFLTPSRRLQKQHVDMSLLCSKLRTAFVRKFVASRIDFEDSMLIANCPFYSPSTCNWSSQALPPDTAAEQLPLQLIKSAASMRSVHGFSRYPTPVVAFILPRSGC
jgi:hypothetical protein